MDVSDASLFGALAYSRIDIYFADLAGDFPKCYFSSIAISYPLYFCTNLMSIFNCVESITNDIRSQVPRFKYAH